MNGRPRAHTHTHAHTRTHVLTHAHSRCVRRAQSSAEQRRAAQSGAEAVRIGQLAAAPQHRLERFQNKWKHASCLHAVLIGRFAGSGQSPRSPAKPKGAKRRADWAHPRRRRERERSEQRRARHSLRRFFLPCGPASATSRRPSPHTAAPAGAGPPSLRRRCMRYTRKSTGDRGASAAGAAKSVDADFTAPPSTGQSGERALVPYIARGAPTAKPAVAAPACTRRPALP